MPMAASANPSTVLDSGVPAPASRGISLPIERRHAIEYLPSRGLDVPLALFWGSYVAACAGIVIVIFWR